MVSFKHLRKIALAAAPLFACTAAFANMTIYPMAVGLDAKGEGSVRIFSKTNDVQFVKTTIKKINDPGTPQEKEVEVSAGTDTGLVIMPPKFAVPGGASKTVRFVAMEPVNKEAMYRVLFEGVPSLDDSPKNQKGNTVTSAVNVNLVWGILVTVPPVNPIIELALSADNSSLQNHGTQRVKITDIGLCRAETAEKACTWKKENRNIFPDKTYSLPASAGYEKVIIKYYDWIKKSNSQIALPLNG
ncbi:fimbrial protein [Chimaeribacter arupi]|uniref:Fimbrial protein n=1 Tax=Chimaeribacter arupi TaxID=2060066 RepID=A0A2N5EIQ2_9GAMM|nr:MULTISPECIES: fimbria/pilus periplasmic chaperone [Yersiniaceae]MDV5139373.1 fimbria/pilus periplasmic chaperone [Chimaeribacter arupi]PLR44646.1 fimbrial protein [Chimaeribacter arupi]PLR44752.1 fimbrial protein [Chimaeribacter arupi]WKZ91604.1 fimbria/pilus periplasmic chaperone [Chimaeribacter arupi]